MKGSDILSRTVKMYKLTLDKRYLDKTSGITQQGQDVTGVHFIDDTELVNPVMKLSAFDESNVNYVYIPSLRRYYYVTDVTYSKGYYLISLHVDVLMSFKESIKTQTVVADRSSTQWRQYIDDSILKTEQYKGEYIRNFSNQPFSLSTVTYILGVLGSGS